MTPSTVSGHVKVSPAGKFPNIPLCQSNPVSGTHFNFSEKVAFKSVPAGVWTFAVFDFTAVPIREYVKEATL